MSSGANLIRRLFLLAAQMLQVDASQILVCEDAVAGVLAAKTAGMKCLGIAANGREFLLRQAGADLVAEDFTFTSVETVDTTVRQNTSARQSELEN